MNLLKKQKQTHRRRKQTYGYQSGRGERINKMDEPLTRLIKKKKGEKSNQQNQK